MLQTIRRPRFRFAGTLLATLVLCGTLRAEPVDMAQMSCSDFVAVDADEQVFVLAWFSGYINGIAGNTRIDPTELLAQVGHLRTFCAGNTALPVLQALPRTVSGVDAPATRQPPALPTVRQGLPPGVTAPGAPAKPTPQ